MKNIKINEINEFNFEEGFFFPNINILPEFNPFLRIGILASGEGSNFNAIAREIHQNKLDAEIKLLIVNNPKCQAIDKAISLNIPYKVIDHRLYSERSDYDNVISCEFKKVNIEGIVMAGWMRIVTDTLINSFPGRIINLHPSILPSYPETNAIQQALDNGSIITGCSTHYVEINVDSGELIAQAALPIGVNRNKHELTMRIRRLEHKILPMSIALAGLRWRKINNI